MTDLNLSILIDPINPARLAVVLFYFIGILATLYGVKNETVRMLMLATFAATVGLLFAP